MHAFIALSFYFIKVSDRALNYKLLSFAYS